VVTPVHITKRALAVVGGREPGDIVLFANACDGKYQGDYVSHDGHGFHFSEHGQPLLDITIEDVGRYVDHPACLVLLDAELEGRGVEAQRQRAEIEASHG